MGGFMQAMSASAQPFQGQLLAGLELECSALNLVVAKILDPQCIPLSHQAERQVLLRRALVKNVCRHLIFKTFRFAVASSSDIKNL